MYIEPVVFGYLQTIEPIVVLVLYVEETIQHAPVHGFSESAGTCVEEPSVLVPLQDVLDQQ